ncbi:sugar transferase [Hoyosella sp. G463]|uniref:Sugar transferase n=1 Tax=Lolliginicoccus lacisalsi TaxID=2742202 RepID=A0A927JB94_9ACTN|nr:sugar transferase [Lolliginicoccus lacisalsi]MBD8506009.1 sugar transferase [Lolliginicoccus lacisalsi]
MTVIKGSFPAGANPRATENRLPAPATPRPATPSPAAPPLPQARHWSFWFRALLRFTDTFVILAAVAIAQIVRFGVQGGPVYPIPNILGYTAVSVFLVLAWSASLALLGARDVRIIGTGGEEYQRIIQSTLMVFGLVAIIALLLRLEIARGYLAIALPLGLLGLLSSRWLARRWLSSARAHGHCSTTVIVLGGGQAALEMMTGFRRQPALGYRVAGVCIPDYEGPVDQRITVHGESIPILGDQDTVIEAVRATRANTVAVTATEQIGPQRLRDLAWQLQEHGVDLVVHPGVIDVAGPRLKIRPVAGMPLLHVEEPQYEGATRIKKALFDRCGALAALMLFAPVMIVVALAIKLHDRGPVFYRQVRVGKSGEELRMWKFRSMVPHADTLLDEARAACGKEDDTFFKAENDPRITPIGRFIRRTSIDELPQLFNVLRGEMSLVGPRPLVKGEGEHIPGYVERRILVRPGMTGLWQVSGRSGLSDDDRVRLDLSYVENWSMMQDIVIMWRTVRTVINGDGAY